MKILRKSATNNGLHRRLQVERLEDRYLPSALHPTMTMAPVKPSQESTPAPVQAVSPTQDDAATAESTTAADPAPTSNSTATFNPTPTSSPTLTDSTSTSDTKPAPEPTPRPAPTPQPRPAADATLEPKTIPTKSIDKADTDVTPSQPPATNSDAAS